MDLNVFMYSFIFFNFKTFYLSNKLINIEYATIKLCQTLHIDFIISLNFN